MKMRQSYIDIVKVFAIMCLFFAHVQGPTWLENIRGFDVPLMVILSGILCASSHDKIVDNPIVYIKKRLKRLTIPSWFFFGNILFMHVPGRANAKSFRYNKIFSVSTRLWFGGRSMDYMGLCGLIAVYTFFA